VIDVTFAGTVKLWFVPSEPVTQEKLPTAADAGDDVTTVATKPPAPPIARATAAATMRLRVPTRRRTMAERYQRVMAEERSLGGQFR